jgi:hypothetical protein
MHPLCNFLQVMTAKEFESLMNGPALIDRGKSLDLSSGQGDSSIPSPATSPRSFGTPVNHNLKKGMPLYIVCNKRMFFNLLRFLVY